jgi:peptidoglycan/xylan/chitin deacetylase (PgdA/CDA1 family)
MRRLLPLAAAIVVFASACTNRNGPQGSIPSSPPMWVFLDRRPIPVDPGTTLRTLVADQHLRAVDGRLLAVDGSVLDAHADLGRIVVRGRRATPNTVLAPGDHVAVVNGSDRTEATVRRIRNIGWRVGDPERTLDVYRTQRITTVGRRSGIVASVVDRSIGSGRAPRAVALTFDDGPTPGDTQAILRVLRRFHVHATFFMIGRAAASYPNLVRRVRDTGNEIGNHTFDHPETLQTLSEDQRVAELRRASAALADGGVVPTLFRPPGGWYDDELVQDAREQDMRLVMWSVDPRDWRSNVGAKAIAREVLRHVEPGSIVLLHDGGGDAEHTVRALPTIIRGIRKRGLEIVTVPAQLA